MSEAVPGKIRISRVYRNTTPATPPPKIQPAGRCGNIDSVDQLSPHQICCLFSRTLDLSSSLVESSKATLGLAVTNVSTICGQL